MKSPPPAKRVRTREAAAGSVSATCTTFSRPSAIDKIVRPSGNITPGDRRRRRAGPGRALAAILARIRGVDQKLDLARTRRGFDPFGAVDEVARPCFHPEPVERRLAKRSLGPLTEV